MIITLPMRQAVLVGVLVVRRASDRMLASLMTCTPADDLALAESCNNLMEPEDAAQPYNMPVVQCSQPDRTATPCGAGKTTMLRAIASFAADQNRLAALRSDFHVAVPLLC